MRDVETLHCCVGNAHRGGEDCEALHCGGVLRRARLKVEENCFGDLQGLLYLSRQAECYVQLLCLPMSIEVLRIGLRLPLVEDHFPKPPTWPHQAAGVVLAS
jgi:hypothetical protein